VGLAVPVLNGPECSSNGCHVHPAEQRVLGVLDLEFSTAELETALREGRKQMSAFSILAILGISGVAGLLTWRVAVRPLQDLLDGIRRLGRGELSHRLPTAHPAEIGELAVSFNEMSRRLEMAQRELETWNQSLEERIREKTRELERTRDQMVFTEKMASLGKLAAIMAHEINNPLAGVLVYSRLLRRRLAGLSAEGGGEAAERMQQFDEKLALIESETARCGDIVRNLLLFSRRREMAREPADVNGLVDRAVKLIRHQADLGQVAIELDLDRDLKPVVCDPSEIEQAVLALLMNAIEAMPDGGRLQVRTGPCASGERAEISITDSGPGIPEELQSRVFEPFFSTKSHGRSTGLGLAVVYGIAQRHGGNITLSSTPGQGATFRLAVPFETEPALASQSSGLDSLSGSVTRMDRP
jgi:two-component system NtrC family sensor kinase